MNIFRIIAVTGILFLSIYDVAAQQDTSVSKMVNEKLQKFASTYPPEKVYLHFDKPYYSVADTIWFKAYVVQGENQPTVLSKIVYVDIITASDSLVYTAKLPVNNGAAYGNIPLGMEDFKQGNYYVRAYTLWMVNFDPDYYFNKNITIGEAIDKQLVTHIKYITGADKKVTARISFKDKEGKPYGLKQVNWQILTNLDEVNKGKMTTDASGVINVPLQTDKRTQLGINSKLVAALIPVEKEPPVAASFDLSKLTRSNDIQFFPEGGELIAGLPIQVAFKAIKADGLGIAAKGIVKDDLGGKVAEFNGQTLGMGSFFINAVAGRTYKAEVTFADGTSVSTALPTVKTAGIALQVNGRNPKTVDIKIMANEAYLEQHKGKTFYVIGQHNGQAYFSARAELMKQVLSMKVDKQSLPMGMLQLSLLSSTAEPISERLVFVNNKSMLNLSVKADKPTYGIKQKVVLTLSAKDTLNVVEGAGLSLSVIDETKVPFDENAETTILSSLLLTSDLKGYVEKPNYYFNRPDEKKMADLDVLMLTQGFRRFTLKEILADKFPVTTIMPEQGITISGTLRNKTGLPINKGTMLLTIPDKRYNKQMITTPVGGFRFNDLVFNDSSKVTLSAKYNPNPNNLMMLIDGFVEPALTKNKNKADEVMNIDSTLTAYLSNSSKQYRFMQTIKAVNISGGKIKKPSHLDHSELSTLGPIPDFLLNGDNLGPCNFLTDCMRYKLTGVTFHIDNFYVTRSFAAGSRTPMLIYLNGQNIDYNGLNMVSSKEVESIEVFLRDEVGTLSRANNTEGIIIVNTKREVKSSKKYTADDLKKLFPDSHTTTFTPKGYSREREFYQPKYSTNPAELNFTDLRTTVYWNPKIVTDANGNATVSFFNADGKGNYKAVLEGTDKAGNVARTVFRYVVK